jgi:hypothetical protein
MKTISTTSGHLATLILHYLTFVLQISKKEAVKKPEELLRNPHARRKGKREIMTAGRGRKTPQCSI